MYALKYTYVCNMVTCSLTYLLTCLPACLAASPSYLPTNLPPGCFNFNFLPILFTYTSRAFIIIIIFNTHICNEQSVVSHKMLLLLLLYILNKYAGCHFRLYDSPSYNVIVSRVSYIRIVYNFHFTDCNFRKLYRSFIHNWRTLHCIALHCIIP